ncbi:unnamed protein product [Litomosoides sigmodontis]|uniref:Uncharacterized protein n=1 Tax=Litomosoides sigmodontis TaxID=42156 RepID=A0A3P6S560_LITSI|nr:unnamed protein product [Litomosoides sigmodontis]
MGTARINGHTRQTSMMEASKCDCCPYGFHIDLGFVDFVKNHDGNIAQKNSAKYISDENSIANKWCGRPKHFGNLGRATFSPLDSIFSDSLENVVSDFEEVFNFRESNSERGSRTVLNDVRKNIPYNGYSSDYGPTQSSDRPLQLKMHVPSSTSLSSSSSSRKPSEVQQYGYHTALGRAMSVIKSKHQNDELTDELQKTLFATKRSRAVQYACDGESRSYDSSLPREGKVRCLDNRTQDVPRRSFASASTHYQYLSDTEAKQQPQWRIRSSVERSSSALDIDGFVSMRRRRKSGDSATRVDAKPPAPYQKSSPFSLQKRLGRDRSSPPHLSFNFSTIEKYPIPKKLHDVSATTKTSTKDISNGGTANGFVKLMNGDALAVASKDPNNDVNASRLCFQCCNLEKQLSDLSNRLKEATDGMKSKEVEELRMKREERVVVDKSVGGSCEMLDDGTVGTVEVEKKDAASDALHIEVEDKRTGVSLADQIEMHWYTDSATSALPEPQRYSIGVTTDDKSFASSSPPQNAIIDSLRMNNGCGSDTFAIMCDFSSMTDAVELVDSGSGSKQTISLLKDSSSMTTPVTSHSRHVQTEHIKMKCRFFAKTVCVFTSPEQLLSSSTSTAAPISQRDSYTICDEFPGLDVVDVDIDGRLCCSTVAIQTEFEPEQNGPRIIDDAEISESLWLIPLRDKKDVAVGNEDDVVEVPELPTTPDTIKLEEEVILESDNDDTICVVEETLSDPGDTNFECLKCAEHLSLEQHTANNLDVSSTNEVIAEMKEPQTLGHVRAALVKKMLTEKSQPSGFIRGTTISKSWRPTSKKGDSLQYIVDQHKTQRGSVPSVPQTTKGALKEKVNLKKDVAPPEMPLSKVPEPVPARIPRPKISKYIPGETVPQSPDEEAEIADRLTPLRSEMRTLRTYANGRATTFSRPVQSLNNALPRIPPPTYDEANPIIFEDSTSSSSDSEGSYDTNEAGNAAQFELTVQLNEAIEILKKHFQKPDSVEPSSLDWAIKHAKHEWLKTAARKTASAIEVEGFVDFLEAISDAVLKFVINLTDSNENTALHYAVSHGNFDVVSVLLDSRAGYTAVMLASLCDTSDEVEAAVIHRLFQLGDVNAQAIQHGQTALMLAASHGKINTTKLLIDCQADLNIQDEEGSTALMCAAEHGHKEIVKLLLLQQNIDASLSDCDSSTALSIAVENGHRDIGVLIYAHLNHSCKQNQNQQKIESTS